MIHPPIKEGILYLFSGEGRYFYELSLFGGKVGVGLRCVRVTPQMDASYVLEEAFTENLFGENLLIVFPDYHTLKGDLREVLDRAAEPGREKLRATLIVTGKGKKDLISLTRKGIPLTDISRRQGERIGRTYVEERFRKLSASFSPEIKDAIILVAGDSPGTLVSAVDKVELTARGKERYSFEEFLHYCGESVDLEIFSVLKKIFSERGKRGMSELYHYIRQSSEGDIMRSFGAFQWSLKKELGRARREGERKRITLLLEKAVQMDLEAKGGSRFPPKDVFLNSLVSMCEILERKSP